MLVVLDTAQVDSSCLSSNQHCTPEAGRSRLGVSLEGVCDKDGTAEELDSQRALQAAKRRQLVPTNARSAPLQPWQACAHEGPLATV